MRFASVIVALTVPVVLFGGVAVAEEASARALTSDLTEWVEDAIPDASITGIDLRGRPYVVSRNNHEVSTASVDITTNDPGADIQLIVQNLDLTTDRARRVLVFATLPYSEPTTPLTTPDGAYTPRAVVDGRNVTFHAKLAGRRVTVTTDGGDRYGTVRLPDLPGLELRGEALATRAGVLVEVASVDVRADG